MPLFPPPGRTPPPEPAPVAALAGELSPAQLARRQHRRHVLVALLDALEGDVLNEYSASAVLGFADALELDLDVVIPILAFAVDAGWLVRTTALLDDGLSGIRLTARGILAIEAMALESDPVAAE